MKKEKVTNAEAIAQDLMLIHCDETADGVASYINCPSSDDCSYDGEDSTPCVECKIRWLRSEFEG